MTGRVGVCFKRGLVRAANSGDRRRRPCAHGAPANAETRGFEVVIAPDGEHALRQLDEGRFDAVLVDIFMPAMDGLETIRAFRQRSAEIAIVAMSGTKFYEGTASAPDFLSMATKLGANASLRKPFRSRELIQTLEACLRNPRPPTNATLLGNGSPPA